MRQADNERKKIWLEQIHRVPSEQLNYIADIIKAAESSSNHITLIDTDSQQLHEFLMSDANFRQQFIAKFQTFMQHIAKIQEKFGVNFEFARTLCRRLLEIDPNGNQLNTLHSGTAERRCQVIHELRGNKKLNLPELLQRDTENAKKLINGALADLPEHHEWREKFRASSVLKLFLPAERSNPAILQHGVFADGSRQQHRAQRVMQFIELLTQIMNTASRQAANPHVTQILQQSGLDSVSQGLESVRCQISGHIIRGRVVQWDGQYYSRNLLTDSCYVDPRNPSICQVKLKPHVFKSINEAELMALLHRDKTEDYRSEVIGILRDNADFKALTPDEQNEVLEKFRNIFGWNEAIREESASTPAA